MSYREKISSLLFGHAAILVLLTGFCLWYVVDAWSASPTVANLILIAPLGIAGMLIGLTLLVVKIVRGDPAAADGLEPVGGDTIWMIVALVGYVVMMPVTGFAFSTAVYMSVSMWILGIRKPLMLIVYPLIMAMLLVFLMGKVVTLPDSLVVDWIEGLS